ncbi:hypothetical protein QJS66_12905 [Kocuria rhizophila]|nr:hypothetical protein QJS66_12905 [Kocuria rhizophila]
MMVGRVPPGQCRTVASSRRLGVLAPVPARARHPSATAPDTASTTYARDAPHPHQHRQQSVQGQRPSARDHAHPTAIASRRWADGAARSGAGHGSRLVGAPGRSARHALRASGLMASSGRAPRHDARSRSERSASGAATRPRGPSCGAQHDRPTRTGLSAAPRAALPAARPDLGDRGVAWDGVAQQLQR